MNRVATCAIALALFACGPGAAHSAGSVGSTGSDDTVVQTYGRSFHFDSPFACDPFVVERIVDTTNDDAEYDARASAGSDTLVEQTYSLLPHDAYPVRLDVSYTRGSPPTTAALWTIALGPHDAELLDAHHGVVLTVHGYDGATPSAAVGTATIDATADVVADARSLERCMLPVQTALGFVPAFFQNRQETSVSGNVVGGSEDLPAILPAWDGGRTILGAYLAAAVCLDSGDGVSWRWKCECPLAHDDALLGAAIASVCGDRTAILPQVPGWWKAVTP